MHPRLTVLDRARSHAGMISTATDLSKQLLIIRFEGTVSVEDATSAVETIRRCLQELGSGFRLLTDLSDLKSMEDGCAPIVMHTMDLCAQKGIKSVYRIMPDPSKDIGFNIMSRFHYGHDVHTVTFENREEAEEHLKHLGPQERR